MSLCIYIPLWLRLNRVRKLYRSIKKEIYIPLWLRLNLYEGDKEKRFDKIYIPLWLRLNETGYCFAKNESIFTFHYGLD